MRNGSPAFFPSKAKLLVPNSVPGYLQMCLSSVMDLHRFSICLLEASAVFAARSSIISQYDCAFMLAWQYVVT